ncbi:MAG: choice-of-anchor Q domain-containing protein, partial [Thermomicrobiales bacterium]
VFTIATDGFLTASGLTLTGAAIGILVNSNSTATLNNLAFSNNGIGLQVSGGVATVTNATAGNNSSGIFIQSGSATLANVTLASNTIRGMSVAAGTVRLTNATIASNGTGIERTGGTVTLTNTIVALNSALNCNGTVASDGNNLDSGTSCGFGSANGSLSSTPAGLSPAGLQFNGGQTQTVALTSNSSARDAGNNGSCGETGTGKVNAVDQRGVARPQGAICDMGAVELTNAACTVTNLADSGAGTLRQCLGLTEVNAVTFQPGLTGNITLASNLSTVTRVVSLTGPGASLLTVNRNNLNALESVITVGANGDLTVSGLTLVGAETGLWVQTGGSATVTDVVLNGNIYGLWTDGTLVTMTNSTASGNNFGLVVTAGIARVTGATFAGGTNGVLTSGGTTSLINATLTSNAAGVFVAAGTVTLKNVTVANNTEGIHRDAGSVTLTNTIVAANTNANCSGTINSSKNNLDSGTSCGFGSANGNKSSTPAGLDSNGLQFNGGPTQTIALLPSSAAINAGDDDTCNLTGPGTVNSIDQRGIARPQGPHCDIGAFELVYVPVTLTTGTTGTGSGTISPATGAVPTGAVVAVTADPNPGSSFIGWQVDNVYAGWASTLTITLDTAHTVQAIFAPTKLFSADVPGNHPYFAAITELASRGTILGYDSTHYGPNNGVQRAQMAALIARAMPNGPGTPTNGTLAPPACTSAGTWDCEDWGNTFTDQGGIVASLWRDAGTLQHYGVAFGYTQQDCANQGRQFPCYGPTDPVSYAQTITFIARAMIAKGYWVAQPNAPLPGGNVPGVLATPLRTFASTPAASPTPPPTGTRGLRVGLPRRSGPPWIATGAPTASSRRTTGGRQRAVGSARARASRRRPRHAARPLSPGWGRRRSLTEQGHARIPLGSTHSPRTRESDIAAARIRRRLHAPACSPHPPGPPLRPLRRGGAAARPGAAVVPGVRRARRAGLHGDQPERCQRGEPAPVPAQRGRGRHDHLPGWLDRDAHPGERPAVALHDGHHHRAGRKPADHQPQQHRVPRDRLRGQRRRRSHGQRADPDRGLPGAGR